MNFFYYKIKSWKVFDWSKQLNFFLKKESVNVFNNLDIKERIF